MATRTGRRMPWLHVIRLRKRRPWGVSVELSCDRKWGRSVALPFSSAPEKECSDTNEKDAKHTRNNAGSDCHSIAGRRLGWRARSGSRACRCAGICLSTWTTTVEHVRITPVPRMGDVRERGFGSKQHQRIQVDTARPKVQYMITGVRAVWLIAVEVLDLERILFFGR